jgi:hypothetical protein
LREGKKREVGELRESAADLIKLQKVYSQVEEKLSVIPNVLTSCLSSALSFHQNHAIAIALILLKHADHESAPLYITLSLHHLLLW